MAEPSKDEKPNIRDDIDALRQAVRHNNSNIESLAGALMQFAVHADERTNSLEQEIVRQRKLSKYNRLTHFWTMAAMVFGALLLADVSRSYADTMWWGLVFWGSQHGSGSQLEWIIRTVGFAWQAAVLFTLTKRAQVPPDLWPDVAAAQVRRERQARRRERRKHFRSHFS